MSEPIEKQESPPEDGQFEEVVSIAKPKNIPAGKPAKEVPEGYHITPKGQVRKNRTPKVKVDATTVIEDVAKEDLAALLTNTTEGIHAMLAELVDPACALSHSQAVIEGEAIARIMDQYKMDPDGKYIPWFVLVGTLCLCETQTAVVIGRKIKASRAGRPQTGEIVEGVIEREEVL